MPDANTITYEHSTDLRECSIRIRPEDDEDFLIIRLEENKFFCIDLINEELMVEEKPTEDVADIMGVATIKAINALKCYQSINK